VFPDLNVNGGNVSGVQVFAAESLAVSGSSILFDASRMAVADNGLQLSLASQATLAMTDDGDGTPNFSLWQRNCTAMRAERMFGVVLADPVPIIEITSAW